MIAVGSHRPTTADRGHAGRRDLHSPDPSGRNRAGYCAGLDVTYEQFLEGAVVTLTTVPQSYLMRFCAQPGTGVRTLCTPTSLVDRAGPLPESRQGVPTGSVMQSVPARERLRRVRKTLGRRPWRRAAWSSAAVVATSWERPLHVLHHGKRKEAEHRTILRSPAERLEE